jgi:hypothetical protein
MEALVSDPFGPDSLSATRHYVLVVRLAIPPGGRYMFGEVLDPETGLTQPFIGLAGLRAVVRQWLTTATPPGRHGRSPAPKLPGNRRGAVD